MRTMFDAVTASNIPRSAAMVAGYVDQIKIPMWSQADWNLFPSAVKVQIVKKASSNFGLVLDVEVGDATPGQAPGWVAMRRKTGASPTVYCNASTWPAVRAAFKSAGVAEPTYWIAKYDGVDSIPADWAAAGCVAKQYKNTLAYDLSIVADFWPGVDTMQGDDMAWTEADFNTPLFTDNPNTPQARTIRFRDWAAELRTELAGLVASNAALTAAVAALSKDGSLTADQVAKIVSDAVVQNLHITVSGS